MDRSTGADQERQSSTSEPGVKLPAGFAENSPGLAAALAGPEIAREAAAYAATLPLAAVLARGLDSGWVIVDDPHPAAPQYVDRGELVTAMADRYGISDRVAAAAVRIAEALRAASDEYPDLTDEDAVVALHAIEDSVRRAGVPR
ncbi:hypothetical protein AB0A95_33920 [Micromonospora sp. NPDC049230]|uniref:hypothetical protein n=1 Tax=Micromonospora sp. NPDC049230 TaxID=3155502 RepID=UPI0033F13241